MTIYRPPLVHDLQAFYGSLLSDLKEFPNIKSHLAALAKRMLQGIQAGHAAVFSEISNYHPRYLGTPIDVLETVNLTLEDCQTTIANEYGFPTWATLEEKANKAYDYSFESAVNYLLLGKLTALKALLAKHPRLIHQQSQYGHRATLLHYTASNGVEFWRQQVPSNLPEITSFLLAQGADKKAHMQVYGGKFTTLPLLKSSAHPFAAGIAEEMSAVLT